MWALQELRVDQIKPSFDEVDVSEQTVELASVVDVRRFHLTQAKLHIPNIVAYTVELSVDAA